jgi:phosphate starvation-inducible protein PhoH
MVKQMFDLTDEPSLEMLYGNLKTQGTLSFWSTSFIRGTTLDNCIIIVDEMQNLSSHELDSIITRVGNNSKIMFCGDTNQSDLIKQSERNGINLFLKIVKEMDSFDFVEFGIDDIVRSGLVKQYLTKKYELKIDI